jgi:two-component system sensor histidine kinase TctE
MKLGLSRPPEPAGQLGRPPPHGGARSGSKVVDRRTLFGEILDWLLTPLLLLWPLTMGLTWLLAQGVAKNPSDQMLEQLTQSLSAQVARTPVAVLRGPELRWVAPDGFRFQLMGKGPALWGGQASLPPPPEGWGGGEGLSAPAEVQIREDRVRDQAWRVAWVWARTPDGQPVLVQVGLAVSARRQLATDIVKAVMLPQLVMLPVAVLLVWLALARGMSPLGDLQARIRARDSHDLSPIDEQEAPEELGGVVRALNELLARLKTSLALQKQFLADAAHQLKTPLAGLKAQAELAQAELKDASASMHTAHSLAHIARASGNAAHMVNQLLSMAKAEDRELAVRLEPVNLEEVAKEVLNDLFPAALDKGIDLGLEGNPPVLGPAPVLWIQGNPVLLKELLRNLVDNALKYSPVGARVTVRVLQDPFGQVVVLQVEDNGPGIPVAEQGRIFEPFYRALGTGVEGSGLGLAIVREIAVSHHAELSLSEAQHLPGQRAQGKGRGCLFTVRFPAWRPLVATDARA